MWALVNFCQGWEGLFPSTFCKTEKEMFQRKKAKIIQVSNDIKNLRDLSETAYVFQEVKIQLHRLEDEKLEKDNKARTNLKTSIRKHDLLKSTLTISPITTTRSKPAKINFFHSTLINSEDNALLNTSKYYKHHAVNNSLISDTGTELSNDISLNGDRKSNHRINETKESSLMLTSDSESISIIVGESESELLLPVSTKVNSDHIIPDSDCSDTAKCKSVLNATESCKSINEIIRTRSHSVKDIDLSKLEVSSEIFEKQRSDESYLISDSETSLKKRSLLIKRKRLIIPDSDSDHDFSDLDYIPDEDNSLSFCEKVIQPFKRRRKQDKYMNSYEKNIDCSTEVQVEFLRKLHVLKSDEGGKYYKKESCCPYCKDIKLFWRLDRHLLQKHMDQQTVMKFDSLPKKCKERLDILKKLRIHRNMRWNTNSIVNTTGKLLVTRRLSKRTNNECITLDNKPKPLPLINNTSMNAEEIDEEIRQEMLNYQNKNLLVDIDDKKKINKTRTVGRVKCDKCPMFVSRKNISVHYRLYHATGNEKDSTIRNILKNCHKSTKYIHPLACQKLKEDIFPTMREDDIFDIIKYDTILILYLNEICEQYDVKDQNNLIKNHARALGRFISVMRKIGNKVSDLESCIKVNNWNATVNAIREIAGFSKSTRIFNAPSTAQFYGLLLKNVMRLMKSYYNQKSYKKGLNCVVDYETEFNSYWLTMIGSKIVSSQNLMKKKNEGKTIGEMSSNDVNLLIEFLDQRRIILFEKIKETLTKKLYNDLIAAQMIYVQCSNGRRPGETARTLLSDYTTRMTHDTNNEFFKMLDPEEKERTIKYSVMDTKGKKLHGLTGRVYLRAQDEMILDFLITQRNSVNILSTNEYLYAPAPEHSDKNVLHMDAHIAMKKLVD
ncbi:hypothetical protein TKK_0013712 [Trichogramma kaykai]|uniref:C2H2-type domain-containing protein n=1 Tax=Trichogramma kaykai TaxID=54128 RepID=A0ABD2WGR0_9HYME